eukprot:gb/GFBE01014035.1/.p1 GENE.gb/GFBE01014035.1/~~gb/GFBE01014035.1/.p1  ORF type:complete len:300 (+),score=83.93 gb/GFBE01014035.1/:1-900(+)
MYSTQGYGDNQQQPFMTGGSPQQGPPGGYQQQGYGHDPYGGYAAGGMPAAAGGMPGKGINVTSDWSVAFFLASVSIMLGATVGAVVLLFSFELVDFLEMIYLFIFGCVLAVMDTPCFKQMKTVKDHREYFSKYVNLLTRVTGKGITFLFLGCSLFSGMWENLEGGGLLFLAFVLCLLPVIVGIAALLIGFMKSQKLNRARQALAQDLANVSIIFDQYARTYPGQGGGLTMLEFSDLTNKTAGIKWEDADLKLIFMALVSNPAWRQNSSVAGAGFGQQVEMAKIPKEDFMAWVNAGMVWL